MTEDLEQRKRLTFEQAEGVEPLPSQLQLRELSPKLRAALWHKIHADLVKYTEHSAYGGASVIIPPWSVILMDEYVYRQNKMADDFSRRSKELIKTAREVFERGSYTDVFGWIEFVLKHRSCPHGFASDIEGIFRLCMAAYRVIDGKVICPIASDTEHAAVVRAFADLANSQFQGARAHLAKAASQLSAGRFADSVRESIHAVESVARTLDPSADLSKALGRLEQKISMHAAMKRGFVALYGYASDEEGIRHALLDEGDAKVDEADALFMLGACASFVSYLLNKARLSGLL